MLEPELIARPDNLMRAWLKVRSGYGRMDSLFDHGEVALFDLELEANLRLIAERLATGSYRCDQLRFLPQPKRADENGRPRMRESFLPSVADQVAWMAVLNVIGPEMDSLMPGWSYGNRLYRSVWFDQAPPGRKWGDLRLGPYRHTTGHVYRRFKHSWPLFRRHLSLVARTAARGKRLDEAELAETERGAWLMGSVGQTRLDYFDGLAGIGEGTTLYHATFDLEKFYPNLTAENVLAGLVRSDRLPHQTIDLVASMLRFRVDPKYGRELWTASEGENATPDLYEYDGVPTGLMASGFLANVAMLPVDEEVVRRFRKERLVAHFRYVDDHALLTRNFSDLLEWIAWYEDLLTRKGINAPIAREKYDPPGLGDARELGKEEDRDAIRRLCQIDGAKPDRLTTRTLALVSILAGVEPDILADGPRTSHLDQLKYLLLANIPETEIRGDTRASFAAGRIAAMTPGHHRVSRDLVQFLRRERRKSGVGAELGRMDEDRLDELRKHDRNERSKLVASHFAMLLDAVAAHPDKPRLFQRLVEYCRRTGYDGLAALEKHVSPKSDDPCEIARARYFAAFGDHVLARWVVHAAASVADQGVLDRERGAAHAFLDAVGRFRSAGFGSGEGAAFVTTARQALLASYGVAAARIVDAARRQGDASLLPLARTMLRLASKSTSLSISDATAAWRSAIGFTPLTWLHWGETVAPSGEQAPVWWNAALGMADPQSVGDRNAARRYPDRITPDVLAVIAGDLQEDDAGWRLDVERRVGILPGGATPVIANAGVLQEASYDGSVSLYDWVDRIAEADYHDPRATEWTALRLVRGLIDQTLTGPGPMFVARRLHPHNVRVPRAWLEPSLPLARLTWEGWHRITAEDPKPFLLEQPILDYRYSVEGAIGTRLAEHLHAVGTLLWGLMRLDFTLPSAWNIRGQERAVMRRLHVDLENLPISSDGARLLRACLTPRGIENADPDLLRLGGDGAADTEFELVIENFGDLRTEIDRILQLLEDRQVTVLDHQPRQLVPVRLSEAARASIEETDDAAEA